MSSLYSWIDTSLRNNETQIVSAVLQHRSMVQRPKT